jgi:phosphoribosyl 1,2-cyclic phosphodiesterase
MAASFTVLASGSSGNASLLEVNGFGLLVDVGLPPRLLSARLAAVGASWDNVHAAVLTHTHGDHWKDWTIKQLCSRRIPLFAHAAQLDQLNVMSASFEALHRAKLTRSYQEGSPISLGEGLVCRPVAVPHDSDPTFAFRFDFDHSSKKEPDWSLAYASDLGCGSELLAESLACVDVLALEYNHDVRMQRQSARPRDLIARVLGDQGHLSNRQAADLTQRIVLRSGSRYPQTLVQLHISRECNTPDLAFRAGREVFRRMECPVEIITARQDLPSPRIELCRKVGVKPPKFVPSSFVRRSTQPRLPGFDLEPDAPGW